MGQNMGQRVRRKGQHWLDALSIGRETRPGMHADCGGLYLLVSESGGKSWIFRYRQAGRLRDMGLGSQATIGLAEARRRARKCREQRLDGLDPLEVRKAERQRQRLEAAKAKTFAECAEAYIADHKAGWKNPKHAKQWPATLAAYVYPAFGSLPVQVIDTALVMKAIPTDLDKDTRDGFAGAGADRECSGLGDSVRLSQGREPRSMAWASRQAAGGSPSKAKRAKRRETGREEHHAALPYAELPAFMAELHQQEGLAARALEFAILTAARTDEVIGTPWSEIDLEARIWVLPPER